MNKIHSAKTYFILLTFAFIASFKTSSHPHLEARSQSPQEYTLSSLQAHESKVERIAQKLNLTQEQQTELLLLCEEIEAHWEKWMTQEDSSQTSSTLQLACFGNHTLTIHPSAREVCIYLEGHTKVLGQGAFKIVKKAIGYTREDEVAIATPLKIGFEDDSFYLTEDPLHWPDFDSYSTDSSDTDTSFDSYSNAWPTDSEDDWIPEDYVREANILEKIQGCPTVIQIYFISFDWQEQQQTHLPTIVGKYYNGGTFHYPPDGQTYSLEDKLRICHDLLLALSHVHGLKITHNDLHGGNVLLQKQNRDAFNLRKTDSHIQGAYLSDFGLAKMYETSDDLYFQARSYYDKISLIYLLKSLFVHAQEDDKTNSLMLELLLSAEEPTVSVEQLYNQFLALLPELVDEETAKKVTQNALQPKRMKIQKENLVQWQ